MDSPRTTLLRVGGLIDGGDAPVKTPTWVKITNGVITEIIPDIPANESLRNEANSPSTLYIDAQKQFLVPGFIGVLSSEFNTAHDLQKLSEQALNEVLKLGITTLVVNSPDLSFSSSLQRYAIDAQRRTPRISLGAKVTLSSPTHLKSVFRDLSKSPVETVWIESQSQNSTRQICDAVKEGTFHEFNISVLSPTPIHCENKSIMTIATCLDSKNPNERCLMKDGRKIGLLHLVGPNSTTNPSILEALENLDSRVQEGSWGAAHLMGYQDAIGKIQIGYRADLLLIDHPSLNTTQPISIKNVLIDGLPQEIGAPSLGSSFWFWKTVSLEL